MKEEVEAFNKGQDRSAEEIDKLNKDRKDYAAEVKKTAGGFFASRRGKEEVTAYDAAKDNKIFALLKKRGVENISDADMKVVKTEDRDNGRNTAAPGHWVDIKGTIGEHGISLRHREGFYSGSFDGEQLSEDEAEMLFGVFNQVPETRA